jgi:hypothetical protein
MGLAGLSPSPKVLHGAWWLDHADVRVVGQSPAEWGPESQHCSCPKMHGQTVRYGGKKVVGCGYCTVLQCAASQVSCLLLSLSLPPRVHHSRQSSRTCAACFHGSQCMESAPPRPRWLSGYLLGPLVVVLAPRYCLISPMSDNFHPSEIPIQSVHGGQQKGSALIFAFFELYVQSLQPL